MVNVHGRIKQNRYLIITNPRAGDKCAIGPGTTKVGPQVVFPSEYVITKQIYFLLFFVFYLFCLFVCFVFSWRQITKLMLFICIWHLRIRKNRHNGNRVSVPAFKCSIEVSVCKPFFFFFFSVISFIFYDPSIWYWKRWHAIVVRRSMFCLPCTLLFMHAILLYIVRIMW